MHLVFFCVKDVHSHTPSPPPPPHTPPTAISGSPPLCQWTNDEAQLDQANRKRRKGGSVKHRTSCEAQSENKRSKSQPEERTKNAPVFQSSPSRSSLTSLEALSRSSRRFLSIILLLSTAALSSALIVQPMSALWTLCWGTRGSAAHGLSEETVQQAPGALGSFPGRGAAEEEVEKGVGGWGGRRKGVGTGASTGRV